MRISDWSADVCSSDLHLLLERRFQDADHLPVDIVDRGGEEEQADDQPAIASGIGHRRRPSRLDCLRHVPLPCYYSVKLLFRQRCVTVQATEIAPPKRASARCPAAIS